jgi:hypothetical protein
LTLRHGLRQLFLGNPQLSLRLLQSALQLLARYLCNALPSHHMPPCCVLVANNLTTNRRV